jgi:hypothetical protein
MNVSARMKATGRQVVGASTSTKRSTLLPNKERISRGSHRMQGSKFAYDNAKHASMNLNPKVWI